MAYFPDKQAVKTELQETVNQFDLSCNRLMTANFFEPNIAYVRDNTTREKWTNDSGVFARPLPLQTPVMGRADCKLKTYFIPYRTISNQWHNFITRSPHVPANGTTPIIIQEMPYFKMSTLRTLFTTTDYAQEYTGSLSVWDFKIGADGKKYQLTAKGRHAMKILNQLGYKVFWGTPKNAEKHINALRILAFAKAYLDYYYSSQYAYVTTDSIDVEKIFAQDNTTAYEVTQTDFDNIFNLTRYTWYEEDYLVSQWDNPVSPNSVASSFGTLTLNDITMKGSSTNFTDHMVRVLQDGAINEYGTPALSNANMPTTGTPRGIYQITQYAIDSLKKCTDYVHRYSMAGVRSVDRYLSRFGVLLTSEKLKRSEYLGSQTTPMEFGAVFSTAETTNANVGDYAGQGIINSDGKEHNTFEYDDMKDMGVILQILTINPKISYWQGIDRNNLRTDPESYFNGIFDTLGTQATSAAEAYVSIDGTSGYSDDDYCDNVWGWIARGAHNKLGFDNLSGDFCYPSMSNGTLQSPWHMFRTFDDAYFNGIPANVHHSPFFCRAEDADQYLRIFNDTNEDDGDHFIIFIQSKVDANLHAKPLYDTYDFESEGKRLIMDGLGPKQS